jgi:hypothetical protein
MTIKVKSLPFDTKTFEEKALEELGSSSAVTTPSICLVNADTTKAWKRWTEASSTRKRVLAVKEEKAVSIEKKQVKQELSDAEKVRFWVFVVTKSTDTQIVSGTKNN